MATGAAVEEGAQGERSVETVCMRRVRVDCLVAWNAVHLTVNQKAQSRIFLGRVHASLISSQPSPTSISRLTAGRCGSVVMSEELLRSPS